MDAPDFVENMAAAFVEAGMQRMASRVFAAVLTSPEAALTPSQIAAQLQVSAGAVSGAVGYLEQTSMIRRTHVPGSRHSLITLGDDIWYEVFASRNPILERWREVAIEGIEELPPGGPAAERLSVMRDFFEFMIGELPEMMERWRQVRQDKHGY
ncbi:GbsR/MarR family transcriptional regulator [Tsukamurella spumae]|uniref:MarR family transcriptional regulator n=1 Tax=Tsukamurella spumae TaxID=44753 RepID=A0A846X3F7_9ACTN|nr:MarR family transcriptional regulator [Tsukamurella spumae]NKY19683.1 MarR family transcriptional regulator [Tsukamurella spumae]